MGEQRTNKLHQQQRTAVHAIHTEGDTSGEKRFQRIEIKQFFHQRDVLFNWTIEASPHREKEEREKEKQEQVSSNASQAHQHCRVPNARLNQSTANQQAHGHNQTRTCINHGDLEAFKLKSSWCAEVHLP